jgi:SAM-dependent methyltransferase
MTRRGPASPISMRWGGNITLTYGDLQRNMIQSFDPLSETLKYYESNAKQFYDSTVSIDMNDIYGPFLELLPNGGTILDAGCGSGRDSKIFIAEGFKVVAFDVSHELVKLASSLIGEEVLQLSFSELRFEDRFDGVWASASLLHVLKTDMPRTLLKLSRALKQGGVLYASFKYGNTELIRGGRHFSDYDEASFDNLLADLPDLTLIRYWQTTGRKPGSSHDTFLNVLLRKM